MNRLGQESSLYLRQHAGNPVHWQPWDEAALSEARERDVPILLSVGYSACHWCHVMAHESFEDEETAALMNRLYVNIKVDREERPDLDRVYQLSHQLLTGRGGGWPLTVFLEPAEQLPFFAGTYFPLDRRHGMPSFKEVLVSVQQWFGENRDEIGVQSARLQAAVAAIFQSRSAQGDELSSADLIRKAAEKIQARFDRFEGGYGGAPKFPQAPLLEAVAELGHLESGDNLHEGLAFTLEKMALGGLRDHLDGGFFRYCVDDRWTIPHFEKMLYDNAMLLPLYAEGARRWSSPLMESAARGIAAWLETVMRQESGAYAASIDADAGGEEGAFHVWTRQEVAALLEGGTRAVFLRAYGFDGPPNFESESWHLLRRVSAEDLAGEFGEPPETIDKRLENARELLRQAREARVHPVQDDKQLGSWNALLADGYVRAGVALQCPEWLDRAEAILHFIRRDLWTGDGLLAVYNAGNARFHACLDDYAWLLNALIRYLGARWDAGWLNFAIEVADALLERFEDVDHGGFWFSDAEVTVPVARGMIFQDDATPAGNAGAIIGLNRLGRLLGEPRYLAAAERALERARSHVAESPPAFASILCALRDSLQPLPQLVIGGRDEASQESLQTWVLSNYRVDCYRIGDSPNTLPGVLGQYRSAESVTAWLCHGTHCLPPVHSRKELQQLLETQHRQP